jgi:AcrR family transcriptional regulator
MAETGCDDDIRQRIINVAFTAFTEDGYAATSTLEIATRARISKRTLYMHFRDKQALLVACIDYRARRMRLPTDLLLPRDRAMLTAALETFGALILREGTHPSVMAVFRLAAAESIRSTKVARTLDAQGRQPNRDALCALLARAQDDRLIGPGNPKEMAVQFLALLWGDLMVDLMLRIAEAPPAEVIQQRARSAVAAFLKLVAP